MGYTPSIDGPLVSVIVPMKDVERYVEDAARSVLNQTYKNVEVIVVDDGSIDTSLRIVAQLTREDARVHLIASRGRGIAEAFNTGLAHARGEFLARCDADDVLPAGRFASQVAWLTDHAHVGAVCGLFVFRDARLRPILRAPVERTRPHELTNDMCRGTVHALMTVGLFRTALVRAIAGCRPFFETAEDADFMTRFAERRPVWLTPEHVYTVRLRAGSITRTTARARLQWYVHMARQSQQARLAGDPDPIDASPTPPPFRSMHARSPNHIAQDLLFAETWKLLEHEGITRAVRTSIAAVARKPIRLYAYLHVAHMCAVALRQSSIGRGMGLDWVARALKATVVGSRGRSCE